MRTISKDELTKILADPALLSGELQIPGVTTTGEMFEWLTGPLDTP